MQHRVSADENQMNHMMAGMAGAKRYNDVARPVADKRMALGDLTNQPLMRHESLRRVRSPVCVAS